MGWYFYLLFNTYNGEINRLLMDLGADQRKMSTGWV